MDGHTSQPRTRQISTQPSDSVFAAHQSKHPAMGANIGDNIMVPPVKAHGIHILVGGLQSGAQGHKRTQTRNHLCLPAVQHWQQLLRAAEKTRVPGHHHGKPPVFPVGSDEVRNCLGGNGAVHSLPRYCHCVQHPPGADQAVGISNRRLRFRGHGPPVPRTQAYDADMGRPDAAKSFT